MIGEKEVREVLAWLEERAKNSTSFGSHCHAYEVAARKLREAMASTAVKNREC
jgi:hypothetical protein